MKTITLARKPLVGTVAKNVLEYGSGGLNIEGIRVGTEDRSYKGSGVSEQRYTDGRAGLTDGRGRDTVYEVTGRFPANLILKEEVADNRAFTHKGYDYDSDGASRFFKQIGEDK